MAQVVSAAVLIHAPIEEVWRLMTDFGGYPRWNGFVVRIDAPAAPRVGSRLRVHARLLPGVVSKPSVVIASWAPPNDGEAALVYRVTGAMAWGVAATRTQTLVATAENRCRYETTEVFDGALHRLIPYGLVQRGTRRHADDLKRAAES